VEFRNLSARYKPGLPLVLNNISFTAGRSQKIGIVGRTGAGKSSIIQALFRIF
jgi:ABC-type multidrug transport system fused ATPase/permease subunit